MIKSSNLKNLADYIPPTSVPFLSPFRYAGGKSWLVPKIRYRLKYNNGEKKELIEPFAGGGIVGLTAANENLVKNIIMVELDDEIAGTWKYLLEDKSENLAQRIIDSDLTIENIEKEFSRKHNSRENLAFATIIKNRISHGGKIFNGAGYIKRGENGKGLKSRWYPDTLKKRILLINRLKKKIRFIHGNGLQICRDNSKSKNTLFFLGPPYPTAGKRLYRHSDINHQKLFSIAAKLQGDFLMTYDDSEEIKELVLMHNFQFKYVPMRTTLNKVKNELLIGRDLSWLECI